MATRENIGLFILGASLAILAAGAVLETLEPPDVAEIERCQDWCRGYSWQCECGGGVG